MASKFDTFMSELKELCEKHNVYIECCGYDGELGVYDAPHWSEDKYKYFWFEDKTK